MIMASLAQPYRPYENRLGPPIAFCRTGILTIRSIGASREVFQGDLGHRQAVQVTDKFQIPLSEPALSCFDCLTSGPSSSLVVSRVEELVSALAKGFRPQLGFPRMSRGRERSYIHCQAGKPEKEDRGPCA